MDEDYLMGIKRLVKEENAAVAKLSAFKSKLIIEVNKLRNERDEARETVRKFTEDQINVSSKKIKESRKELEEELDKNEGQIRALNNKAREVVEQERIIAKQIKGINKKEEELQGREIAIQATREDAEDILSGAKIMATKAEKDAGISKHNKEVTNKAVAEAIRKLKEVTEYDKEKRELIAEKERVLNSQYKISKVKEELMDNKMSYIKIQKEKIQDQWASILNTKKELDGRSK